MKMQLPPPNNFSIAKNRPAYSDQRQGISGRECKRLNDNLSLDLNGVNLPNLYTRVDFYIGKLNSFLEKDDWFNDATENIFQEFKLIQKEANNRQRPTTFLGLFELQRRSDDFSNLISELNFKNPAEQKQHIVDLIEKYNQLKQRIDHYMSFPSDPTEPSVD